MKILAVAFFLSVAALGCGNPGHDLRGTVHFNTGTALEPDAGAEIRLYHLQDSTKLLRVSSDANGSYYIDDLPAGSYLRVAVSHSAPQTAMDFLRELVLHSTEARATTGYDAVSNMSDELKAAIAFGGKSRSADVSSSPDLMRQAHEESLAMAFISAWPEHMRSMFPEAAKKAILMQVLDIKDGENPPDQIGFGL